MNDEERKALNDFNEFVSNNGNMQEFINLHRHYCRMVAIQAKVKYLSLLIDDYHCSDKDDQKKFLNQMYENSDLMEEDK